MEKESFILLKLRVELPHTSFSTLFCGVKASLPTSCCSHTARWLSTLQQRGKSFFVGIREETTLVTWNRWKSAGLKSLGEQPHQSTMCLYWHLQPSLRFQFVMRKLLSTMESQYGLFSRTVWKKDCKKDREDQYIQLLRLQFSPSLQPMGVVTTQVTFSFEMRELTSSIVLPYMKSTLQVCNPRSMKKITTGYRLIQTVITSIQLRPCYNNLAQNNCTSAMTSFGYWESKGPQERHQSGNYFIFISAARAILRNSHYFSSVSYSLVRTIFLSNVLMIDLKLLPKTILKPLPSPWLLWK